ncbi:MAG TPA: hypothetical protein VGR26_08130, partial [Acidimicrobiales bacterium]|nr:hypothetical protein [Acidimicrobiales bacterium]
MGPNIVSSEETSTQVADRLHRRARRRRLRPGRGRADGLVDRSVDDQARPILLAVSGQGPQMTSGSTREFMAPCAIACHFARPAQGPGLDRVVLRSREEREPAPARHLRPGCAPAELTVVRSHCNGVGLHSGMGYVCLDVEHVGKGPPSARPGGGARG